MGHNEMLPTSIPNNPDPVLTKVELAKRWKVCTKTVDKIIRDGLHGVRYFKVGQQIRFRLRDIEQYEEKHLRRLRPF